MTRILGCLTAPLLLFRVINPSSVGAFRVGLAATVGRDRVNNQIIACPLNFRNIISVKRYLNSNSLADKPWMLPLCILSLSTVTENYLLRIPYELRKGETWATATAEWRLNTAKCLPGLAALTDANQMGGGQKSIREDSERGVRMVNKDITETMEETRGVCGWMGGGILGQFKKRSRLKDNRTDGGKVGRVMRWGTNFFLICQSTDRCLFGQHFGKLSQESGSEWEEKRMTEGADTADDCSHVPKNTPGCFSGNLQRVLEGDKMQSMEFSWPSNSKPRLCHSHTETLITQNAVWKYHEMFVVLTVTMRAGLAIRTNLVP